MTLKGWDSCPPAYCSPPPSYVKGAWFDVDAVVKVVRQLLGLRHTKGRWAGKPLVPDAWQLVWFIAPVMGWKYALDDPDDELAGCRIVRDGYLEVPRKNGKSTISSGLLLVLLAGDGEQGGEVYALATTKDQARQVFEPAKAMVQAAPGLKPKVQVLKDALVHVPTQSAFRVLASLAGAAHGLNVSGAVVDELHVHKSADLLEAIETGTGARAQPLVLVITTAGDTTEGTVYDQRHEIARKLALGIIRAASQWAVIFAAEDGDPFAEDTMRRANPGLGKSPTLAFMRGMAEKAQNDPAFFNTYCRLHLNRRTRLTSRWLNLADWDRPGNVKPVVLAELKGRQCWGGLDLSATTDLTAAVLVFPDPAGRLLVVPKFWLPEDELEERTRIDHVPYREWHEAGHLTLTDGNVVDYDEVIAWLEWARSTFRLRGLGHDRWQAGPVVQHLAKRQIDVTPIGQTYAGMSFATKQLKALILKGGWQHGGHPVLRWNADCVEVKTDDLDNVRPVKPDRASSGKRVDGITAAVMAVDTYLRRVQMPAAQTSGPSSDVPAAAGNDFFRPSGRLRI